MVRMCSGMCLYALTDSEIMVNNYLRAVYSVQERISENVEEGTMPESSSKKLEQDYEESSFESDTDDPDES